jgi:hypothetical protein
MLLNLLNAEVNGDQLLSEIYNLDEVLSFINGELEPNVSGPSHSEKKESDQKHNISNISVNFFKRCKAHSLPKIFQHHLAIPLSNAFVERVFSVMQNI